MFSSSHDDIRHDNQKLILPGKALCAHMNTKFMIISNWKLFPPHQQKNGWKIDLTKKIATASPTGNENLWPVEGGLHQIELKARCFVIYVGRGEAVWFIFAFFAIFASRPRDGLFATQSLSLSITLSFRPLFEGWFISEWTTNDSYHHVEGVLISFTTIQKMVAHMSSLILLNSEIRVMRADAVFTFTPLQASRIDRNQQ